MPLSRIVVKDAALYMDGKKIATIKNVTIEPSPPTPRYINTTADQTIRLIGTYSSATPNTVTLVRPDRPRRLQWRMKHGSAGSKRRGKAR